MKDSNLEIKYLNIYYSDFCGSISMDSSMARASYFPIFDFHITNTYDGGHPLGIIVVRSKGMKLVPFLVVKRWYTFIVHKNPVIQLGKSNNF